MLCSKCRSVIPTGSKYCWKCGEKQEIEKRESSDFVCVTVQKDNNRHIHVTIPISTTGAELIEELSKKDFLDKLEIGQYHILIFERTKSLIKFEQPISSLNIQNGDIISVSEITRG